MHSSGRGALIKTHCLYSLQEAPRSFSSTVSRYSFVSFVLDAHLCFRATSTTYPPLPEFPGVLLQKLSGNSLKITRNESLLTRLPLILFQTARVNNQSLVCPRGHSKPIDPIFPAVRYAHAQEQWKSRTREKGSVSYC